MIDTLCIASLHVCELKAAQLNVLHRLIQELMIYKFELGHNAVEANKSICCVKGGGAVDHSRVTRYWLLCCMGLFGRNKKKALVFGRNKKKALVFGRNKKKALLFGINKKKTLLFGRNKKKALLFGRNKKKGKTFSE